MPRQNHYRYPWMCPIPRSTARSLPVSSCLLHFDWPCGRIGPALQQHWWQCRLQASNGHGGWQLTGRHPAKAEANNIRPFQRLDLPHRARLNICHFRHLRWRCVHLVGKIFDEVNSLKALGRPLRKSRTVHPTPAEAS